MKLYIKSNYILYKFSSCTKYRFVFDSAARFGESGRAASRAERHPDGGRPGGGGGGGGGQHHPAARHAAGPVLRAGERGGERERGGGAGDAGRREGVPQPGAEQGADGGGGGGDGEPLRERHE